MKKEKTDYGQIKNIDIQKAKDDIIYFVNNVLHVYPVPPQIDILKQGKIIIAQARHYKPREIRMSTKGINSALVDYVKQFSKKMGFKVEMTK